MRTLMVIGVAIAAGVLFFTRRGRPELRPGPPGPPGDNGGEPSPILGGSFTIEGVRAMTWQNGSGPPQAIAVDSHLGTNRFSAATITFQGKLRNEGNVPIDGQLSLLARSDQDVVSSEAVMFSVAPGASQDLVVSATVDQAMPPGALTAAAVLAPVGAQPVTKQSGVLATIEEIRQFTFEGGFNV